MTSVPKSENSRSRSVDERANEIVRLADLALGALRPGQEWPASDRFPPTFGKRNPDDPGVELRRALVARDLRRVDSAIRRVPSEGFDHWAAAAPDTLDLRPPVTGWPLINALAMHPDGRVREAAVGVLAGVVADVEGEGMLTLGVLALRCADAAPHVRRVAQQVVQAALPAIPVRALVRWERLLLSGRIRRLAPTVVADVERLLLDDPAMTIGTLASVGRLESLSADVLLGPEAAPVPALLGAIGRGGAHRRLFQEGLRRAGPWDLRRFLQHLRGGPPSDVTVWVLAADAWPGIDRVALGEAELTRLEADALAPIHDLVERRVVRPDDAAEYVVNALLAGVHASAGRRMAQRLLAAAGVDVAAHYRLLLDAAPMAIVGLGEVGHRADASLVVRFFESADEDQRWAAVNALKLDPDTHLERLVAALDDPSERVARAAAWRLRRTVGLVGPDRLFTVGARHRGPHAAGVCAYLLTTLPTDSLLGLLARRHGGSDDDRDFALQVLAAWRDVLDFHRPVAEHFQERLPSRAVAAEISRAMSGDRRAARLLDVPERRTPEGSPSLEEMRRVWDDIENPATPDPDHPRSG